jgi:hypothetical protein
MHRGDEMFMTVEQRNQGEEPQIEKYWTPGQVGKALQLDPTTVIRKFRDYPGVLKLEHHLRNKRPYVTLRIPDSVLQRFLRERSR